MLNVKVYVEKDKWSVLQCLDLPAKQRGLLTRNINEAGVHVMPMWHVRASPFCAYFWTHVLNVLHACHSIAARLCRMRGACRCADDDGETQQQACRARRLPHRAGVSTNRVVVC